MTEDTVSCRLHQTQSIDARSVCHVRRAAVLMLGYDKATGATKVPSRG